MIKEITLCILLILQVSPVFAGGTSVQGKITKFVGKDGNYIFQFQQTVKVTELIPGCLTLNIKLIYKHVPWYSWAPFVETTHPTYEQTEEAAIYLLNSFKDNKVVNFGYMGSGLQSTNEACSFESKGLLYFKDGNQDVLSFYNPV